jgi:hypothetical protein
MRGQNLAGWRSPTRDESGFRAPVRTKDRLQRLRRLSAAIFTSKEIREVEDPQESCKQDQSASDERVQAERADQESGKSCLWHNASY